MMLATMEMTIGVANLVVSTVLTVALFYVASKTRVIDRLQDRIDEAAKTAAQGQAEHFQATCALKHQAVAQSLSAINERLGRGDEQFDNLGEAKTEVKLTLASRIESIKDLINEKCASRTDVEALKTQVNQLAGRFDELSDTLHRESKTRIRT